MNPRVSLSPSRVSCAPCGGDGAAKRIQEWTNDKTLLLSPPFSPFFPRQGWGYPLKIPTAPIVFPLYFCVEYDRVPHDRHYCLETIEAVERETGLTSLSILPDTTNTRALPVARPTTFSRSTLSSVVGLIPLIHYYTTADSGACGGVCEARNVKSEQRRRKGEGRRRREPVRQSEAKEGVRGGPRPIRRRLPQLRPTGPLAGGMSRTVA